jgi:hypothetical protein
VKFRFRRVFLRDERWRWKLSRLPSKNQYSSLDTHPGDWTRDCTLSGMKVDKETKPCVYSLVSFSWCGPREIY